MLRMNDANAPDADDRVRAPVPSGITRQRHRTGRTWAIGACLLAAVASFVALEILLWPTLSGR